MGKPFCGLEELIIELNGRTHASRHTEHASICQTPNGKYLLFFGILRGAAYDFYSDWNEGTAESKAALVS